MSLKIFSVSELTGAIRSLLEPHFRGVSVRGEISNFKLQSSGHLYFSLKDTDAQISAALFRSSAAGLPRMPKDGDQVIAKGELSIYAPRGSYQIIVRELQFLGVGELLLKFHQLKELCQSRGWFDPAHKKALPKLPRRIGIVTSPTGAVIQDILNILTRRFANVHVILNPVKVQGEGAANEIATAIADFNRYHSADVLIVGRGGGSIEDLQAFNEEIVARAIFQSDIPIISAVGHETDFTIADWVADLRAPTPSAAAEIVIAEKAHLLAQLKRASMQSAHFLRKEVEQQRARLSSCLRHPMLSLPHSLLARPTMRLDGLKEALDHLRPSQQIFALRERLTLYTLRLSDAIRTVFSLKKKVFSLALLQGRIDSHLRQAIALRTDLLSRQQAAIRSLHPTNLLQKGYSILFNEKGDSVILSAKTVRSNQQFTAVLADGRVRAVALQIEETHEPIL